MNYQQLAEFERRREADRAAMAGYEQQNLGARLPDVVDAIGTQYGSYLHDYHQGLMPSAIPTDIMDTLAFMRGNFEGPVRYPKTSNLNEVADMAMDVVNPMAMAGKMAIPLMTAWHGTPHKFDKFDMSKIGMGEGNQAYGHGLYFADRKGIAEGYREDLSGGLLVDGKPFDQLSAIEKKAAYKVHQNRRIGSNNPKYAKTGYEYARQDYVNDISRHEYDLNLAKQNKGMVEDTGEEWGDLRYYEWSQKDIDNAEEKLQEAKEGLAFLEQITPDSVKIDPGSLYKVDIPDEAVSRMLDWDAPLSEQSDSVKRSLESIGSMIGSEGTIGSFMERAKRNEMFGGDIVGRDTATMEEVSQYLSAAGIPGLRYYDAVSRKSGKGTRNTVLFDDSLATILERNGIGNERTGIIR